jgi:hypothetical protein
VQNKKQAHYASMLLNAAAHASTDDAASEKTKQDVSAVRKFGGHASADDAKARANSACCRQEGGDLDGRGAGASGMARADSERGGASLGRDATVLDGMMVQEVQHSETRAQQNLWDAYDDFSSGHRMMRRSIVASVIETSKKDVGGPNASVPASSQPPSVHTSNQPSRTHMIIAQSSKSGMKRKRDNRAAVRKPQVSPFACACVCVLLLFGVCVSTVGGWVCESWQALFRCSRCWKLHHARVLECVHVLCRFVQKCRPN